jgi:hypothetical protein
MGGHHVKIGMLEPREMPPDALSRRFLKAVGRSILSAATIGSVAIGVFALAHGHYQLAQLKVIVCQNVPLLAGVFAGLLAWNCRQTFHRTAGEQP